MQHLFNLPSGAICVIHLCLFAIASLSSEAPTPITDAIIDVTFLSFSCYWAFSISVFLEKLRPVPLSHYVKHLFTAAVVLILAIKIIELWQHTYLSSGSALDEGWLTQYTTVPVILYLVGAYLVADKLTRVEVLQAKTGAWSHGLRSIVTTFAIFWVFLGVFWIRSRLENLSGIR